ncbi:MAG: Beta-glucuronidase [Candidatus Ordinivivax streblomastigis]|uniref:Beta-glucuronidase n=1 Tax=Candidatus Ordinivivax streblomastigis TaxID=2540710 RepID=A0A5M8NX89_9BACT|nr:MAG: Beta-glucuronidase [Candidatus Ordinivivax streblomastigis]KAA6301145.1 MAG: Beta-glucuronidase [Candidatus Ordinivivax streblomastigis]
MILRSNIKHKQICMINNHNPHTPKLSLGKRRSALTNLGVIFMLLYLPCFVKAQEAVLQNVYARDYQTLNGSWNYIIDPFDMGYYDYRLKENPNGFFKNQKAQHKADLVEYNFDTAPLMLIPSDWNTQNSQLFFYEGSVWFKKDFTYFSKSNTKTFIYFGAVNYDAKVYLNSEKIGEHIGGFTPFNFDITDKVKDGNNFIVVRGNNERHPESVPTVNADWWNYGGITREVLLVDVPEVSIDDYVIQLEKGKYDVISGKVQTRGLTQGHAPVLVLEIPELKIKQTLPTDESGIATFSIKSKPQLWSPENPKLYDVTLSLGDEKISDQIGFRQIETVGKEVHLNGKKIFLKGISIHEEAPFRQGRAWSPDDAKILLGWAKELGCNFVRLAHYPHNEYMVREAEKLGLMVWSEIPVYWTIHWSNPDTYANAQKQLNDMIDRDKNRGNIIIWSVANETPHSDARDQFLANLAKFAREKDNTRLISMAMEVTGNGNNTSKVEDYMNKYVDIISFNNYLGWYGGTMDDLKTRQWEIPSNKPFFISEFGAGALQGKHGDKSEIWTEEYQAELYKQTLAMYDRVEGFAGTSPWILVDFYSPRRQLNGIQDFFNRKGLISNNGVKKQAFFVLQDFYKKK